MKVYIIYTTTYVCKQRVVALLLMELLSKMRKMRTITPPDATSVHVNIRVGNAVPRFRSVPVSRNFRLVTCYVIDFAAFNTNILKTYR